MSTSVLVGAPCQLRKYNMGFWYRRVAVCLLGVPPPRGLTFFFEIDPPLILWARVDGSAGRWCPHYIVKIFSFVRRGAGTSERRSAVGDFLYMPFASRGPVLGVYPPSYESRFANCKSFDVITSWRHYVVTSWRRDVMMSWRHYVLTSRWRRDVITSIRRDVIRIAIRVYQFVNINSLLAFRVYRFVFIDSCLTFRLSTARRRGARWRWRRAAGSAVRRIFITYSALTKW